MLESRSHVLSHQRPVQAGDYVRVHMGAEKPYGVVRSVHGLLLRVQRDDGKGIVTVPLEDIEPVRRLPLLAGEEASEPEAWWCVYCTIAAVVVLVGYGLASTFGWVR